MDIPSDLARRISDAARSVMIAKGIMERAKTFDERRLAQIALDQAEQAMQDAAMNVNRGLERAPA